MLRSNKKIAILIFIALCIVAWFYFSRDSDGNKNTQKSNNHKVAENVTLEELNKSECFLCDDSNDYTKTVNINRLKEFSKFDTIYTDKKKTPVKTNQWFSSVYFSKTSENMFAFPWALKFLKDGFGLSVPQIGVSDNLIMGAYTEDLRVVIDSANEMRAQVIGSGDFSADIVLLDDKTLDEIGVVTITHGSPFVFYQLKKNKKITISVADNTSYKREGSYWIFVKNNLRYGVIVNKDVELIEDVELGEGKLSFITKSNNALITLVVVPEEADFNTVVPMALDPIEDTKAYFVKTKKGEYFNVFEVITKSEKGTLLALLPHQSVDLFTGNVKKFSDKKFSTIRGEQEIYEGSKFFIRNSSFRMPSSSLDLTVLSVEERGKLKELLLADIENFSGFKATDTYFLGKEVLRAAQVYDLAMQLGLESQARKIKDILYTEFSVWKNNLNTNAQPEYGKYFTYDTKIRGIIGHKTSFGSEEFNDHHFHYGYFVHAAALLGKYDKEFVVGYKDVVNLFLKDYLNTNRDNSDFSFVRDFDLYEGHSWAAGTAMFGDGNNQESTSEAIHAYYAGWLWNSVVGNKQLTITAAWLYNQEINTALTYWMLAKKHSPQYAGYRHSLISLLWGGKSEFGTWFSGEPEAKVGIQLIPFTPASEYLKDIPAEIIEKHLAETIFPQKKMFFDQLLMYEAIKNPAKALELFNNVEDADLDGGNSKSFLYAWIVTRVK